LKKEIHLRTDPKTAETPELLVRAASQKEGIPVNEINHVAIRRKSVDARSRTPVIDMRAVLYVGEEFSEEPINLPDYPDVSSSEEVLIIGAGPAGLFAALKLIELGKKPVILERGKDVKARIGI